MFDWNDVQCFLAVARGGSTLAAAKAIGVNQTTVARRISALEDALGLQLFERVATGYRLSDSGQILFPLAIRIEKQAAEFANQAEQEKRHISGMIRVTTSDVLAKLVMMPVIGAFSESFPNAQIQMIVDDRLLDLVEGEADLALRVGAAPRDDDLIARRLVRAEWGLYCSKRYVARRGLPADLQDLRDHALLGFDSELDRMAVADWFREKLPGLPFAARSNTLLSHLDAIRTGLGVGALPRIEGDQHEDLSLCIDRIDCTEQSLWLVMRASARSQPHVRAFADSLIDYVIGMRDAFEGNNNARG